MSHGDRSGWKGLGVTIAAVVLFTGLARAECPTGLGGGVTYVVDLRGVLTLTTCDQTWLRGVESGHRVRIPAGAMTVVTEPGDRLELHGGSVRVQPRGHHR